MAKKRSGPGRPISNAISEAQERTLKALREFIAKKRFAPTMSELGAFLGITAVSAHQFRHGGRKSLLGDEFSERLQRALLRF